MAPALDILKVCDSDHVARTQVVVVRTVRTLRLPPVIEAGAVAIGTESTLALHLCKHHYERHERALEAGGWRPIVDTRSELT